MVGAIIAALSLASSLTLEVPYLPQTDALCGGAAAAMVFRYWGEAHADVQQFAPLVDRRAGGIADAVLIDAVKQRGWKTVRFTGTIDQIRARLRDGQPVIVLLADRGKRYHYVVVVGATADQVIVHDPSWGPSRAIDESEFLRVWEPTNFWALLVLPSRPPSAQPEPLEIRVASGFSRTRDQCDALLDKAVADVRLRGLSEADTVLADVQAQCPAAAGPLRELAGVRFAQHRWDDAAALARRVVAIEPEDAYAWDVLGSSLFMKDDPAGALRAWNRIGKPRVNVVRIDGLSHAKYQVIAEALGVEPNTLLTADTFERARRRLDELPDRAAARLSLRPEADGFATVDVVVSERSTRPHGAAEWATMAVRSAVDRDVTAALPGATGQGELWTASWQWWRERPRVALGFAVPGAGGLPGVWRLEASWDAQTYAFAAGSPALRESRVHGGLTVSDWLTGRVRYSLSGGFDSWDGTRKAASAGAALERRMLDDRVSVAIDAKKWLPVTGDPAFHAVGARAWFRSSSTSSTWVFRAVAGVEHVGDAAPLAVWPGAGDGQARTPLLRAHPLLEGGVIDARRSSAFGRTLTYSNTEVQRWFDRPRLPQVGIAGFVDVARAGRRETAHRPVAQVDVGTGLRVKVPGWERILRVDVAHGVRDGRNAVTVGWLF